MAATLQLSCLLLVLLLGGVEAMSMAGSVSNIREEPYDAAPGRMNATVSIRSKMGANTVLLVHCMAEDGGVVDNLGEETVQNEQVYSFCPRLQLQQARYHCRFQATGYPVAFVGVYFGSSYPRTACSCKHNVCPLWTVNSHGFFCGTTKFTTWY